MRFAFATIALLGWFISSVSGSLFLPFLNALDGDQNTFSTLDTNATSEQSEQHVNLFKRQSSSGGCPSQYNSCQNLGAPGLCCANSAVCSADSAGYVACCPKGAACTGTITGIITSGSIPPGGALTTSTALSGTTTTAQADTSTSNGMVLASTTGTTTSNGGFIIAGTSTVAVPASAPRRVEIRTPTAFQEGRCLLLRRAAKRSKPLKAPKAPPKASTLGAATLPQTPDCVAFADSSWQLFETRTKPRIILLTLRPWRLFSMSSSPSPCLISWPRL
ncbi:hypothetical protein ANO11243_041140 [Dothideomycetidae sp. 11243]|nr:hypothetical protein ANO11243_041140 [fungal sp. No.11243]